MMQVALDKLQKDEQRNVRSLKVVAWDEKRHSIKGNKNFISGFRCLVCITSLTWFVVFWQPGSH